MWRGETIQLSSLWAGTGGAGRIGWRVAAFETARERRAADLGGGDGADADAKASISLVGGASTGAPGKSTVLVGVGSLAATALAFSEVSSSTASERAVVSPKKASKPSGMVFGEHGGESGGTLPFVCDVGLLRGEISSSSLDLFCANGKFGELYSGSRPDLVGGLAGSHSSRGAGRVTRGHAGCAGSYSFGLVAGNGGLDGKSMLSEELCNANGDVS